MTSLNPTLPVGFQISESARTHLGLSRNAAGDRAVELLSQGRHPARARPDGGLPAPVLAVACGSG